MLTAKNSKENRLEGFGIGIDHFINKPFDKDELNSVLINTLENRKKIHLLFRKEVISDKKAASDAPFVIELKSYLEIHFGDSALDLKQMLLTLIFQKNNFVEN